MNASLLIHGLSASELWVFAGASVNPLQKSISLPPPPPYFRLKSWR
jgi:hypothetical protein